MKTITVVPKGEFDPDKLLPERWQREVFAHNSHMSNMWWTGYVDGEPACIWGIVPSTMLSDDCYMWMAWNELVDQNRIIFARWSRLVIEAVLERWPVIFGYCSSEGAERFLKWLGAKTGELDGKRTFRIERTM